MDTDRRETDPADDDGWDLPRIRAAMRASIDASGIPMRTLEAEAGVGEGQLRRFLAGRTHSMFLRNAVRLARCTGVSLSTFIGEDNAPPPNPPGFAQAEAELLNGLLEQIEREAHESSEHLDHLLGRLQRFRRRSRRKLLRSSSRAD